MTEHSGLFDAPSEPPSATKADTSSLEQRLDGFADAAKAATQLAGKLRLSLNRLAENARLGSVAVAEGQVGRLSESVAELSALLAGVTEQARELAPRTMSVSDYMGELEPELVRRGVKATKGPEPYWLAYPAWFKIERDVKGSLEIILNGERLDSIRPTAVATAIAAAVSEKFQAKQFTELLISIRDLFRRAGASGATLRLDDVFEVLATGPGRRSARGGEFSKAAFYYSVHRLAEEMDRTPRPAFSFPPANRTDAIFFTKDGDSRKYLTVDFAGPS